MIADDDDDDDDENGASASTVSNLLLDTKYANGSVQDSTIMHEFVENVILPIGS